MPGNANSGRRPPQTDSREKIDPNDRPSRPADLRGFAAEFWAATIVPCDHLRQIDTANAVECSRQYDLYRRATIACESIPLDDVAAKTAAKYFAQWQALMKELDIGPKARMKQAKQVRREKTEEATPESRFFGVTG